MKSRALFLAVAGALLIAAAFAPRANATVIVYFNFEDGTLGAHPNDPGIVDTAADVVGAPDFNPGGGIQMSTLDINSNDFKDSTGLLLNRTAGDIDTANPGQALTFLRTAANQGASVCFTVDTTFLSQLSLSFAIDNSGNGYTSVELTYNINGTGAVSAGTQTILNTSSQLFTFDGTNSTINNAAGNGTTVKSVEFCLVFTGGQSNGANGQTTIDNIVLGGTVIPEPATVVGGLLGVLGLCWFQRRRLRLILPRLRRT
jgi:hypothetical protein